MDKRDEKRVEKVFHDGVTYERHSAVKDGRPKIWWQVADEYGPVDSEDAVRLEELYGDLYGVKKDKVLGVSDVVPGHYAVCSRCDKIAVSVDMDGIEFISSLNVEGWRVIEDRLVCFSCLRPKPKISYEAKVETPNPEIALEEIEEEIDVVNAEIKDVDIEAFSNANQAIYSVKCDGCQLEIDVHSPQELKEAVDKYGIKRVNEFMLCQACRRKNKVIRSRRSCNKTGKSVYAISKQPV